MKFTAIAFSGYYLVVSSGYYGNNLSVEDAKKIIGQEYQIPTPEIIDAIHDQSTCKPNLQPKPPSSQSSAELQSKEFVSAVSECKDKRLISGAYKNIVVSDDRYGIYGWWVNGTRIQPFHDGHTTDYKDYSQAFRLVHKKKFSNKMEAEFFAITHSFQTYLRDFFPIK